MKVTRPISSKSNSTRYEATSSYRKKQDYEQFHDEDDDEEGANDEAWSRPDTHQNVKRKPQINYEWNWF